jgi:hypothetical protein
MGCMGILILHSNIFNLKKIQFDTNVTNQLVYGVCFNVGCYFESERTSNYYSYICCSAEFAGSLSRILYLYKDISE